MPAACATTAPPAGRRGRPRPAAARVRPRRDRPGRRPALPRAPQRARGPPRPARARRGGVRAHGHQPARPLRRAGRDGGGRAATRRLGHPAAGRAGDRRLAARRRPRGLVGRPRLPVRPGPARPLAALGHRGRPRRAAARGRRRGRRAGRRGGERRPALGAPGGRAGAARRAAPAVPLPLPARGGAADLRGRPPRREGAEETGPRRAPDRARGGGSRRPRGGGGARLLRGRALGAHRRRPAPAGGLGAEAAGAAWGGRRQLAPGRERGGLSQPLRRIATLVERGLERTAALWPDVRRGYRWLRAAAFILAHRAGLAASGVQARYERLLAAWAERRGEAGTLAEAVDRFVRVTASYRPGLFHCYRVEGLPRTDNGLEQLFGAYRHHERRATGRKAASPATVLRGSVRLIAGTATRLRRYEAGDLATADRQQWEALRRRLEQRHTARVLRCRFRRNPDAFLKQIETDFLKQIETDF